MLVRFDEAISLLNEGDCFVEYSPLRFEYSPRNDSSIALIRVSFISSFIFYLSSFPFRPTAPRIPRGAGVGYRAAHTLLAGMLSHGP